MTYPNKVLADVCDTLFDWDMTPGLVDLLAQDLAGEFRELFERKAEQAWDDAHDPEVVAGRAAHTERLLKEAGR